MSFQEPKIVKTESPIHNSEESHPAYAQISASRISGKEYLYGSDFQHHYYVTIRIAKSTLHRGLSNDWAHDGSEYIEVALSESQWASFVSTLNCGSGTQCTLVHFDMKRVPRLTKPKDRHKQFDGELKQTFDKALDGINKAREAIKSSKLSQKAKDELLSSLRQTEMNITSNVNFVSDQFGEHMERVTDRAKSEVAAYMLAAVSKAGLASLQTPPLLLEDKGDNAADAK